MYFSHQLALLGTAPRRGHLDLGGISGETAKPVVELPAEGMVGRLTAIWIYRNGRGKNWVIGKTVRCRQRDRLTTGLTSPKKPLLTFSKLPLCNLYLSKSQEKCEKAFPLFRKHLGQTFAATFCKCSCLFCVFSSIKALHQGWFGTFTNFIASQFQIIILDNLAKQKFKRVTHLICWFWQEQEQSCFYRLLLYSCITPQPRLHPS